MAFASSDVRVAIDHDRERALPFATKELPSVSRYPFSTAVLFFLAACSAAPGPGSGSTSEQSGSGAEGTMLGTEESAVTTCSNLSASPIKPDPQYRVVIYPTVDNGGNHAMPNASSGWTLTYKYVVPPLPCSSTWNPNDQTFYIWGDVDFDVYGANGGSYSLSSYLYNQIVPQLMIGDALSGNDSSYKPSGNVFTSWVIQAQYFWENKDGNDYAQTAPAKNVNPGDVVTTTIQYDPSTGSIAVNISTPAVSSSITIPRPFPNESPALFSSWRDFFQQGQAKSTTLYARPQMNVESHGVDQAAMCSVLPWNVDLFSVPGVATNASNFTSVAVPTGSYTCSTAYSNFCTPTTCSAQGKNCGTISDGCGGTLTCGTCASGQTCSSTNVCQSSSTCSPTVSSYQLGKCNATAIYNGNLYKCISQAAGVNGETTGCGTSGVYCSSIAPDNAAWGSTAWQLVQSCGACTPTTCSAQGKNCGTISDGCGGTLTCGTCASGQTCSSTNVCQSSSTCSPTVSSYQLGKCNATAVYNGKLYKCISQAAGVNGETTGCGTAGVYCSAIAPDNAAWGTTAWQFVQNCQ